MNQADVEAAILEDRAKLEEALEEYRAQSVAHAQAEAKYRAEHARKWLTIKTGGEKVTDTNATKAADDACETLNLERQLSEAKMNAANEALRSIRASLSALQTISSNIRAVTS